MKNRIKYIFFALIAAAVLYSCSPSKGDRTGREYMPDMAHSIAYEVQAYQAYRNNTWDSASTFIKKDLSTHLAQAGAKDLDKLDDALAVAADVVRSAKG